MKELIFDNWSFMRIIHLLAGIAIIIPAITSKPLNSTLYGAMMGALLLGIFKKDDKTKAVN